MPNRMEITSNSHKNYVYNAHLEIKSKSTSRC